MTTGAMMGYSPVSAAVGATLRGPLIDWRFGRLYENGGAPDGVRYFDFYPNGIEVRSRSYADIGVSGSLGPWTFCYNNQFYALSCSGAAVGFLRSTDFTQVLSTASPDILCMVSIQLASEGEDIVICSDIFLDGFITAIPVGGTATTIGTIDEKQAVLGAVPDGSGSTAYAIGYNKPGGATQIGLYSISASTLTLVSIAKILPATIDATWTLIGAVSGIAIDQTDGNLIVGLNDNGGGATHPAYIVKLNAATGAVIWKIPVTNGINGSGTDDFKQSVIKNGTLYYIDFGGTLFAINTVAGTFTSTVFSNVLVSATHPSQMSEDVSGSVIWFGNWSEGATHPAYLGDYCLVKGNHSGSSLVWRFFPNGAPNPAPVFATPADSRRRAWSFALDGHVFYCLDLGQQGTFLYDDSTNQWSKFITQGHNGWNLTNGTMWGTQRIVGGDFLSGSIWEMQPAVGMDNDTVDITHVVTGGLTKRSRVYSSVEAVRLNCAIGQLADTSDATVLLEFSDDQGQTFTAADTLSLTEGDFTGEIAWRSLGSFAAPGRVFRITDVGAFLRIDGADGFIDNFDEDVPQQGQPSAGGG